MLALDLSFKDIEKVRKCLYLLTFSTIPVLFISLYRSRFSSGIISFLSEDPHFTFLSFLKCWSVLLFDWKTRHSTSSGRCVVLILLFITGSSPTLALLGIGHPQWGQEGEVEVLEGVQADSEGRMFTTCSQTWMWSWRISTWMWWMDLAN